MLRSLLCSLLRPLLLVVLVAPVACSSDDDGAAPAAKVCAPNKAEACPCPGGAQGVQTCLADGSGFGACQGCPGAAGASGSAGAGGGAGAATGGSGAGAGSAGAPGGQGGSGAGGGAAGAGAGGSAGGAGAGQGGAAPASIETCEQAAQFPSNEGCEFWAVDLDQQDGLNDPASAPWGLVVTATSASVTQVTVEINEAPQGAPLALKTLTSFELAPGETRGLEMPTRELDCGAKPNDYASPGTCLSSAAVRVTSKAPVTVQQFNAATNSFSNDASMLLPTPALGRRYHVIGWGAGHPVPVDFPGLPKIVDRSYVTVVGTAAGTQVTVKPTARVKGNGAIPQTQPGGSFSVTIGPFDVLNIETDDLTKAEADAMTSSNPADLTGTVVEASKPVAVFSGTESAGTPGYLKVPTPPGWSGDSCCLDHLEEQLFPLETAGSQYVITRSPIRSAGSFAEPDILRFVGGLQAATVTTNLPPPLDKFELKPGEIKDTWTQTDVVATSTAPILVGQLLIANNFVDGPQVGDPSLLVFAPVEQFRRRYPAPMPVSWDSNHVVLAVRPSSQVLLDGQPLGGCVVAPAGSVGGVEYEARRCKLADGAHILESDEPFGLSVYGYGKAGSYAYSGGALLKPINPLP